MSLYLDNGYLNIEQILSYDVPFSWVLGGRGTGKTFGSLLYCYQNNKRFMLMRRTQAQCDLINKAEFNPFKAINLEYGTDIKVKAISKYNAKIYEDTPDGEERILGYTCALSTIANMRGFDASDCEILLYDEFVPELHERTIGKNSEGSSFLNAYETLNRNRELKPNGKPMKVLGLANAFNIANPIFLELGLVGRCEKMKNAGQEVFIDRDRGVLLVLLQKSRISKAKADTALYRLSSGSSYSSMALSNDFVYNNTDNVKSMSLKEFKLVCSVGEISIYKHKSKRMFYVSEHRTGTAPIYKSEEVDLKRYRKNHGLTLYTAYMRNNVICESLLTKSLFELYTL